MNILILGGGGREHALAWAIKQNPKCDRLIVAPGNAGIAQIAECADLDILDGAAVVAFCEANSVDFVVVGPEAPLAAGVADATRAAGLLTFGPSQAAARLEASKGFTKEVCDACGAPTAGYARFTEAEAARAHVRATGAPIVIKADGLAAGKGVVVAMTEAEALAAIDDMFGGSFGAAGAEVVIEEFMTGEEASFFVLTDGRTVLPIGTAQDHKRAFDGDEGPNTGGMGAYSPAPVLTTAVQRQALDEIVKPTIAEMGRRGAPYSGVLYAGLMIEEGRARLVEYNVRFGDPECQVLMLRLGAQALDLLLACAEGRLDQVQVNWAEDHALTVVMAAQGYPGSYRKGTEIRGLEALPETSRQVVFHAGTAAEEGRILATGGRVLAATARGATLAEAQAAAYAMVDAIDWPEGFCRRDIGWRAL
ncbi:phosphoribosylamine--glycine ligase [Rhodobacter sphaeroides]|mgnify:CR=1 FL=1|uniref:Phosphoribosylamine--glycine ligase n=1 Tax=Cereibacter sphaeroides (strain ATCC 17023 / DSM 158 / JCM 6121 / CCUG 31486 / LMG 2827 / NBRC 12203 / NCIMB 8253 / ATH 2.4.1.) TaxID=272943 RepID=Q3J5D8_CERS4|nr:phosphoribosylamine--glycine ligase [Cereibacter sphaeroides]ABA77996.1 phosphoribosylamine--glycine ligase [Cereibacter sphaeroides 2.4.1]AMJ48835.1 phosphoribosylamine--glycine ligase [Cereibacter sphaeroides]ANS35549.1 phosphoribosylamine--glycine ligase [Cereibacter sphaeroides]ATN64604.1 phosphoribosylamine--glycine ligase [Cereibacter sphaeroides]AXC62791.1 phosphoribosylamine--glycine ligase [Cereibacter sphaeroides 2.4.1]